MYSKIHFIILLRFEFPNLDVPLEVGTAKSYNLNLGS
jgi:hypothetical protein